MKRSSSSLVRVGVYLCVAGVVLVSLGSIVRSLVTKYQGGASHTYRVQELSSYTNIIPVAVIGSGPAGSAAALYTARGKAYTVLFEGSQPGGQLTQTTWVENWPGVAKKMGPDIMKEARDQAITYGAVTSSRMIASMDVSQWPFVLVDDQGTTYHALSVVIASGAKPKLLNVPGEQTYWGKGVTSCAVCDAPFFAGKRVYVVGGGDSAFEEALQLAPYASHITLLVRGERARASEAMKERVSAYSHIAIEYNTSIVRIEGNDTGVTAVDLKRNGELQRQVPIDGIFLAVGHEPNTRFLPDAIARDEQGYIALHHRQETSVKGIFAAGDVSDHVYRQAGVAAGDGIKAGLDALEFLRDIGYNDVIAQSLTSSLYSAQSTREIPALQELTDMAQVKQALAEENVPVLIDVFTDFCAPCKQLMPIVTRFADDNRDQVRVYKVNALKNPDFGKEYKVSSVPTLIVFKNGAEVKRETGLLTAEALRSFVLG